VRQERWDALTPEERKKFVPLCPDFVIELMSEHDYVNPAQAKMQEWMQNGCQLAWLINAESEETYIYRAGQEMQIISGFQGILSGEDVLPNFTLNLAELRS
jgi:Uma2 family endonuclease